MIATAQAINFGLTSITDVSNSTTNDPNTSKSEDDSSRMRSRLSTAMNLGSLKIEPLLRIMRLCLMNSHAQGIRKISNELPGLLPMSTPLFFQS